MIHSRTRESRAVLAGIAAALSLGLVATLVLPASAAAAVKTRITFDGFVDDDGGTDYFKGDVHSHKNRCVAPRRVKLLREVPGRDVLVGSTRSSQAPVFRGFWLENKEDPPDGRYYARVKPKRGCEGDKSGTRTVDDDPQI